MRRRWAFGELHCYALSGTSRLVRRETQAAQLELRSETAASSLCSEMRVEITPFKPDSYGALFLWERGQCTE